MAPKKRKTNRQRADLTQRGSTSGFSSSQQVKKVGGVQASSGSGTPRNVARFGSIPGMPANAQAPQMDQSAARMFSSLAGSLTDIKKNRDYFAAREIATNDEISRNDTQVQAQEHYDALKVGFEEGLESGNFVFGASSGTPLRTAMEGFLGDESDLWGTSDFLALPLSNQEKIKRDIRSNYRKDAMAYETGKRIESNKNRTQKLSEINSTAISEMAPGVVDGRLIGPDGEAFPRQEWVLKEIANNAHTPGMSFSNIQRAFQNDFQSIILSNPNAAAFEALLKEYETLDGVSLLGTDVEGKARKSLGKILNALPEERLYDNGVALAIAEKNFPKIGPESMGSGALESAAWGMVAHWNERASLKESAGEKLTVAEEVERRDAIIKAAAIQSVNELMSASKADSAAYMEANNWPMNNPHSLNDVIPVFLDNVEVELRKTDLSSEERAFFNYQKEITEASQSDPKSTINVERALGKKFNASVKDGTLTAIEVLDVFKDLATKGLDASNVPESKRGAMVNAFTDFFHTKGGSRKVDEANGPGLVAVQSAMGSLVNSSMVAGDKESAVRVMFGNHEGLEGLNTNEIKAKSEFRGDAQTVVISLLGGQATTNATTALESLEDLAYARLFNDQNSEDFRGLVATHYDLSKDKGLSTEMTNKRDDLLSDIRNQLEDKTLGLIGRSRFRTNEKTYYPRKEDVANYPLGYMSAFVQNAPALSRAVFVPNDVHKVYEGLVGGGVNAVEALSAAPVFSKSRSKADVNALFDAVRNSTWDHAPMQANLLQRMGAAKDPVRAYDLFMQDLKLNTEVVIAANGDWHMQANSDDYGKSGAMASLPGSFQSMQALADDRFMKAVEATYEDRNKNEGGLQEFFQRFANSAENIMEGYIAPSKETFEGNANDHIRNTYLKDGALDWSTSIAVGPEGGARKITDGNFSTIRMESSLNDYWDKTKGSTKNKRNHASSPYVGSDAAHNITRSFAPMFNDVMPQLLDVNYNLDRASSEFNRHLQEKIEAPEREKIEEWMDQNKRTDLNVAMTVGTFSEDTAAFNDDAWDKGSTKPSIMALSARVEIRDNDGNLVKEFNWDVRDEYSLSIFERSAAN